MEGCGREDGGCCWVLQKGWPTIQALGAPRTGRSDGCGPDCPTEEVPEHCFTHCTHYSLCRSPGEEKDSRKNFETVLLADIIPRCSRLLLEL